MDELKRRRGKPKSGPVEIVILRWIDAHTAGLEEIPADDVETDLHFGYPTTSFGLLIRSDEKGVSLATDRQEGPDGSIHYRAAHFVPRQMIVEERHVSIAEPKPKRKKKPEPKPEPVAAE